MHKKKRNIIIILSIIVALIVAIFVGINIYVDSLIDKTNKEDVEVIEIGDAEIAEEVIEQSKAHNVVNIALFGADNSGVGDYSSENRSDAMKIISLDYDLKKIKITSVERDVVAYFPGNYQDYGHYNWAYWFGGPTLAVQTLNYNLDLDITRYVTFSFDALKKTIDLLGGVSINVSNAEINWISQFTSNYKYLGDGIYTLYGDSALVYCRIRSLDSDFVRMNRQNNVINALMKKLKDKSVLELMDIFSQILPYISTNLTKTEIKSYLVDVLSFNLSEISTYKAPEGEYNDICPCPKLGGYLVRSYSNMAIQVHNFIYEDENYMPSETVMENEKRTYERFGPFTKE